MRCVFAFEICLIHLCSLIWSVPQDGWLAQTLFMSVARTGTVGFLMLAGAILVRRTPGKTQAYLSTRLRRWLPLLMLVQLFYGGFSLYTGAEPPDDITWSDAVKPAWYHIWFFYALGLVYIVVVPMRWYANWANHLPPAAKQTALWLPVVLLLAGMGWLTALGGFWGDLRPLNLLIYCGYAWTGHVLALTFPKGTAWAGRLMLAGVAGAALATILASDAAGAPVASYFHRCSAFIAIAAIGQFLLLMRLDIRGWSKPAVGRVHAIARLTLGIFVVHPMLIVLGGWPLDWMLTDHLDWLTLPIAALALFAVSAVVTSIFLTGLASLHRIARGYLVTHPSKPDSRPALPPHPPQSSSR